jgi:hypothetical protein
LAVIETDKAGPRRLGSGPSIGNYDLRIAIAVEVGRCHVARAPGRISEGSSLSKTSLSIILVQQLAVRLIVADDHVQVAIQIEIGQGRRIRPIRRCSDIAGGKTSLAVIQQDAIVERPVAAFPETGPGEFRSVLNRHHSREIGICTNHLLPSDVDMRRLVAIEAVKEEPVRTRNLLHSRHIRAFPALTYLKSIRPSIAALALDADNFEW